MEEVPTLLCHGKFGQVFEQCRFSISLCSVWLSNGYSYLPIWKRFFFVCLFLISSSSHCYFAVDIMQSTGWFTRERKWLNFSEVIYVDIGKAVWMFEVWSNVEADSTEQLDRVRNMNHYGVDLLPGISVLLYCGHVCLVISRISVASGLATVIAEIHRVVYMSAYSYTYSHVY